MKRNSWMLAAVLAMACAAAAGAQAAKPVVGIALGYPPYQFTTDKGEVTGIDADITRLVFKEMGMDFSFNQTKWDDVYLALAHKSAGVDVLTGCEINPERKGLFDFSAPYYSRAVVIFVKSESAFKKIADLKGKVITGDRGGLIESLIDTKSLRIIDTASKEEGFNKLKAGDVDAVIAPLEVGNWICKQLGLSVRTLEEKDPGSPVAFAVAKGNTALAAKISAALDKLQKSGQIDAIMKKYR